MKKQKLAKELSDMVNYCVSRRFEDFQASQQHRKCFGLTQLFGFFNIPASIAQVVNRLE